MQRPAFVALVAAFAALGVTPSATLAQESDGEKNIVRDGELAGASAGKSLAILIGVQDYTSLSKLKYCRADVQLLEKTLREACGFDKVISLTEDAEDRARRPTLGNLFTQLRIWLQVADGGEYQRILLYFSGHGFRDNQGRLYFAPPDCDRQHLELTGLPQSYVKQMLDACEQVPVKLLVLDCCHSGEGKGDGLGTGGGTLSAVFKNAKGLLTLASCRDEEVSLEWEEKGHGLFTYWLCEGLRGLADGDKDRIVDSSELHKYVFNRVQETAAAMYREQQVVWRPSDDWRGLAALAMLPSSAESTARAPKPEFGTVTIANNAKIPNAVLDIRVDGGRTLQVAPGEQLQVRVSVQTVKYQGGTIEAGVIEYYTGATWRKEPVLRGGRYPLNFKVQRGKWFVIQGPMPPGMDLKSLLGR